MKFTISTASFNHSDEAKEKYKDLGFTYEDRNQGEWPYPQWYVKNVDNDNTYIERFVEINTIEELMNFIDKYGQIVIDESHITIYDYYLE